MPGIYISWPFCAQKCTYCNFASGVQPKGLEDNYTEALLAEFDDANWGSDPDTVFLGGGTPSGMEPERIERIMAALPGKPWREATMEAAPGSLTPEKLRAWTRAGINRVSLGVQSFIHQELVRTGRKHNAETVAHDVAMLRDHGISNISIDLIAGLPAQTDVTWRESLDLLDKLHVPHASVYMLEVDEDSRLGNEILLGGKRYGASNVPPEEQIAAFYELATEVLEQRGLKRYEISNFAVPGAESLHNLKYWRRQPYLGFGSDAHSFDGRARWANVETAQEYVDRWRVGESPLTQLTHPDAVEEKFFVGLRLTEGVTPDAEEWQRFGPAFEQFLSTGMMEQNGERLRLTSRGIMVSNEIFEAFVA